MSRVPSRLNDTDVKKERASNVLTKFIPRTNNNYHNNNNNNNNNRIILIVTKMINAYSALIGCGSSSWSLNVRCSALTVVDPDAPDRSSMAIENRDRGQRSIGRRARSDVATMNFRSLSLFR